MGIRTSWVGLAAVVFAALAVVGFAASELQARIDYDSQWLGIDSFTMKAGDAVSFGKESFIIKGTFNLEPNSIESTAADMTLSVGSWVVKFAPSSWTCKGTGKPCKAKTADGNMTANIQYWIGGTSKCKYTFTAKKQDLRDYVMLGVDSADVPVRLQIGAEFDESVTADCKVRGTTVRYMTLAPQPCCIVDKVQVKNGAAALADVIVVSGRLNVDSYDTDVNGTEVLVWGQYCGILPGEIWSMHGKIASIKKTFDGTKKLSFSVNVNTGKFTMTLSKLDLLPVSLDPLVVGIAVTGGTNGGFWAFGVWTKANRKGTVYSY
jgi:hypothetical protein